MIQGYSSPAVVERLEEIAKKRGATMAQIALAWVINKDSVTAPIIGTTSLDKLHDLLGAVHVKLTDEEIKLLEESYTPQPVSGFT